MADSYTVKMAQQQFSAVVRDAQGDRRSREVLLAALQAGGLQLGFRPTRTETYER